jgi:two-component system nitrogen regulation response regulator GlnG/two-component system response regulator HydG
MFDDITQLDPDKLSSPSGDDDEAGPALVIAWSPAHPARVGEIAFLDRVPPGGVVLGRGDGGDGLPRVAFHRHRPTQPARPEALAGQGLSRRQLLFRSRDGALTVENVGQCSLRLNGVETLFGSVNPGDTLLLGRELLLLAVTRPRELPPPRPGLALPSFPFGAPDPHGFVGESLPLWELREQIAFAARADAHVLLLGPSGSGKELAAQAIHRLSGRGGRPIVSRSAATLPAGLIDAELFGNVKNYPHAGMAERPGIIGEADGSTLFLDEIGELYADLQAHLLRVLDAEGEYHRLGESRPRRSDLRLIAATNRSEGELKHDFAARFHLRVVVPGLEARREDIPLLSRRLLVAMAARDPAIGAQFFDGWDGASGEPRLAPELVDHLLRRPYLHHVRELSSLLWSAVGASREQHLALPPGLRGALPTLPPPPGPPSVRAPTPGPPSVRPGAGPTIEEIEACLDRCEGNVSRAWRDLGLTSRDALNRLLRKHAISPRRPR